MWRCPMCGKWSSGRIRCGHCLCEIEDMKWSLPQDELELFDLQLAQAKEELGIPLSKVLKDLGCD